MKSPLTMLLFFSLMVSCQQRGRAGQEALLTETRSFGNVKFIAHMGLSSQAPANTLPAFEAAGKNGGFFGIETDVRETKDGEFVLYHDEDLSTRTSGKGTVISQTLQDVQSYEMLKGKNLAQYKNLKVPRLEDYLAICKKYGVTPVMHIKQVTDAGIPKLLKKISDAGLMEQAIVTGGKKDMQRFRDVDKNIQLYWINYLSNTGTDWAVTQNIHLNSDVKDVTTEKVAYAHKKGLKVGAWTVNDVKTVESLAKAGVDFVTTDYDMRTK